MNAEANDLNPSAEPGVPFAEAVTVNSTHTVAHEDLTSAKRLGFIIGCVVFGLTARWGFPSEPILQVGLKTLLWPAWLVDATIGELSTNWIFVALVKVVSSVSVGAFFAYLFLSYRLNARLAMISLVVSSAATWWFLREYWATWTASPPPGWSAFIFWPAKMVATALLDSGVGGDSNQSLSASAMVSMMLGTAIVHVTIICCVRTVFKLSEERNKRIAGASGEAESPPLLTGLGSLLGRTAGQIVRFVGGPLRSDPPPTSPDTELPAAIPASAKRKPPARRRTRS